MIGRLTGKILHCTPGRVLLDVNGVGYEMQIPLGTFYALSGGSGSEISLHVHTHVREDALQLFGASGYSRDLPLERMYRDVRMFTIGGGTAQILRTVVASQILERKLPQTRDGYV